MHFTRQNLYPSSIFFNQWTWICSIISSLIKDEQNNKQFIIVQYKFVFRSTWSSFVIEWWSAHSSAQFPIALSLYTSHRPSLSIPSTRVSCPKRDPFLQKLTNVREVSVTCSNLIAWDKYQERKSTHSSRILWTHFAYYKWGIHIL